MPLWQDFNIADALSLSLSPSRGGHIYSRGVIMKAQRDLRRGKNVPNNAHAATTTSFVLVVCSRRTTSIPVTEGVLFIILMVMDAASSKVILILAPIFLPLH